MGTDDNEPTELTERELKRISAAGVFGKIGKLLGGLGRIARDGTKRLGNTDKN